MTQNLQDEVYKLKAQIRSLISKNERLTRELVALYTPEQFFKSRQWRDARHEKMREHFATVGRVCPACSRNADDDDLFLLVSLIHSKDVYPDRCLDLSNMEILCEECYWGKNAVSASRQALGF